MDGKEDFDGDDTSAAGGSQKSVSAEHKRYYKNYPLVNVPSVCNTKCLLLLI